LVLLTIRGSEVSLRMLPFLVLTPTSVLYSRISSSPNIVSDFTWWYFNKTMQSLGPAFVKLCQWTATRRDIFPPHWCDRLSSLHDRGIPHSWHHTHEMLTEAFGDYELKGLYIDDRGKEGIIGCGSAAQVYKGRLVVSSSPSSTGTENNNAETIGDVPEVRCVAVKVLHPRFQKLVDRDLWFMQSMAGMLHALPFERIKVLNLPKVTSNFGSVLRRQTDLRIEGENLRRFRSNFYRDEEEELRSSIAFPQPVDGWMSENVLVEDMVEDAIPIAQFLKDNSDEGIEIRKELASPLLRAFLKMVFLGECCSSMGSAVFGGRYSYRSCLSSFLNR